MDSQANGVEAGERKAEKLATAEILYPLLYDMWERTEKLLDAERRETAILRTHIFKLETQLQAAGLTPAPRPAATRTERTWAAIDEFNRRKAIDSTIQLQDICAEYAVDYGYARNLKSRIATAKKRKRTDPGDHDPM